MHTKQTPTFLQARTWGSERSKAGGTDLQQRMYLVDRDRLLLLAPQLRRVPHTLPPPLLQKRRHGVVVPARWRNDPYISKVRRCPGKSGIWRGVVAQSTARQKKKKKTQRRAHRKSSQLCHAPTIYRRFFSPRLAPVGTTRIVCLAFEQKKKQQRNVQARSSN